MEIVLNATAQWEFALYVRDEDGDVDMTGKTCHFVMATLDNVEIARASTTGATGTIAISGNRLDVTIPTSAHSSLSVPQAFVDAYGDLGVVDGNAIVWIGREQFHILSGPAWTGATGA